MNEQIQKIIIDMLSGMKDFAVAEMPDIIRQYLLSKLIFYSVSLIIGILVLPLGFKLILDGMKALKKDADNDFSYMPRFIGGLMLAILGFVLFFSNITDILQIKFAPKGYLLEIALHR